MQTPGQPRLSRRSRLADFFGLKRNLVILLIAIFVIGAGEELWMRFVPKYLQAVGATVFVIGLYDALRTLLGAIYAYPGGVLADRWGHRHAFIIFNVVSIIGYALVLLIPNWGAVIVGMFLFLSWTCFSLPATFSLVGAALEAHRHSMGIGVQSVIKRLPIMIAPIFGGMLIDRLRNHRRRAHRACRLHFSFRPDNSGATTIARRKQRADGTSPSGVAARYFANGALEFLAKPARIQSADAAFAVKRHPDPFLRTSSVCLGSNFCDGLHRR